MKVCTITRLDAVKGYQDFINFAVLLNQFDKSYEFTMVCGAKYPGLRKKLNETHPLIRFLGYVSDVAGFLKTQDAFVLTSKAEGSPAALIEAKACGLKLVVLEKVGAVKQILESPIENYSYESCAKKWGEIL